MQLPLDSYTRPDLSLTRSLQRWEFPKTDLTAAAVFTFHYFTKNGFKHAILHFVIWCWWIKSTDSDMVADTQFHKFYGRSFARVLYLFLMRYLIIGRWLPWVRPGSTGRTISVRNRSAHWYYITRLEGGGKLCMVLLHIKYTWQKIDLSQTVTHIVVRYWDMVTFHMEEELSGGRAKSKYFWRGSSCRSLSHYVFAQEKDSF